MKRIIVICILVAAMLSVAIWEITYSTRLYKDLHETLVKIEENIFADGEEIATAQTLSLMDTLNTRWKHGREVLFCFGNHTTLRLLDEKIVSLAAMIQINHAEDAKVTVRTTKALIEAIANDTHPVITNLL